MPTSARTADCNGTSSMVSTPSTISPTPDVALEEDLSKGIDVDRTDFRASNNRYKTMCPIHFLIKNTVRFFLIPGCLWQ